MECSICLETINKNDKFKLSCNHELHYKCFLSLILKTNGTLFINCPLCRAINTNNERPFDNTIDNLKLFTNKNKRCKCYTREGKKCKNKALFMNNGMCYTHNKEILPKIKYNLIEDFIFYLLETANSIKTKIYMIDIGKKLILKNSNINKIQDILYYFFRYYHVNDKNKIVIYSDMYEYYNLKLPPRLWIEDCINDNIIF
jgi:hypothetical protein